MLGRDTPRHFTLLSQILPSSKNQECQANQRADEQRLVELNPCLMQTDGSFIGEDIDFISVVERHECACQDQREVSDRQAMPTHETSYPSHIHSIPSANVAEPHD